MTSAWVTLFEMYYPCNLLIPSLSRGQAVERLNRRFKANEIPKHKKSEPACSEPVSERTHIR